MENLNWSELGFGYIERITMSDVIIETENGENWKFVLLKY